MRSASEKIWQNRSGWATHGHPISLSSTWPQPFHFACYPAPFLLLSSPHLLTFSPRIHRPLAPPGPFFSPRLFLALSPPSHPTKKTKKTNRPSLSPLFSLLGLSYSVSSSSFCIPFNSPAPAGDAAAPPSLPPICRRIPRSWRAGGSPSDVEPSLPS